MSKKYTGGLRIRGTTCHEHITLFSMENGLTAFDISRGLHRLPQRALISGESVVGPNNDIPVWVVRFPKEEGERIELAKALFEYHNVVEKGNPMTEIFFPHITKKKESELKLGDVVELEYFFLKQVGPHDPILKIELSNEPL